MTISTPRPPAPPKKRGLGCFGCGCLGLVLLILLFVGLVAGSGYVAYNKATGLTSPTPASLPAVTTSDNTFDATRQKLADFDHDVKNHQAATIKLSADEINSFISRDPNLAKNNVHALVTFSGDEAQLQISAPASLMKLSGDRYFNVTTSFSPNFDISTKNLNVTLHSLQVGDNVILSPATNNQQMVLLFTGYFNQSLNAAIRKNPDGALLLDQAKSMEIRDGQLVIETQ
jgi:hypothetical protein